MLYSKHNMQVYFGLFTVLSAMSLTWSQQVEQILRNDFEGPYADGSYRWAFQTEGGIFHEQRGSLQKTAAADQSLLVEGQYQYTAPDGQVINVLYKADEHGLTISPLLRRSRRPYSARWTIWQHCLRRRQLRS